MNETKPENWIGRSQTAHDRIDLNRARAMGAMLDIPSSDHEESAGLALEEGCNLPALWHWLYFWEQTQQAELAQDGHAKRGGFLPPIALPRRMWAAGEVEFHSPLPVGQSAERQSRIESIEQKKGRSGALAFVTVAHEITGHGQRHISEKQTIVYREAASQSQNSQPQNKPLATPRPDFSKELKPDVLMLFRYSALTFNAHRIHYDRGYASKTEGYPGLLVHGPLLATLLANLAAEQNPGQALASFRFRALKPVFDLSPFRVCGLHPDDAGEIALFVTDSDNQICMQASAKLKS